MTIGEQIIEILKKDIIQDEEFEVDPTADLLISGTLDSMALIRLVAAIETKFEFKIPPTDLVIENFLHINAIESYIMNRLAKS